MINCMETHKYVHIVLLCVRACVCLKQHSLMTTKLTYSLNNSTLLQREPCAHSTAALCVSQWSGRNHTDGMYGIQ